MVTNNKREERYGVTQKFNLLMNSIRLMSPFIIQILVAGILSGIGSVFTYFYVFSSMLPIKPEYITLYFRAATTFEKLVTFKDKELAVQNVLEKLGAGMSSLYIYSILIFLIGGIIGGILYYKFIIKLSNKHTEKNLNDQHLRGTIIIEEEELATWQKQNDIDGYYITPSIKINRATECNHVFISGSAGSGKTTVIKRAYASLKNHPLNKDAKFVIHDVKGDYIAQLYNEKTDLIFNMSDIRSINFNIFNYITNDLELRTIVNTIIPDNPEAKEPIWIDSSRSILSGILLYCIKTNQKNMSAVQKLTKMKAADLIKKLEQIDGTEETIMFLSASESQVANYMSNLQSSVKYFKGISSCHDKKEAFDIEKWLKSEGQSTLFMVNDIKNQATNGIRIAVFVEALIDIVLSFKEDKNRRIYLILDEIGQAARMNKIITGLTLGRSFGLSIWIGIQGVSQFDTIYNEKQRQTIVNSTGTQIILRSQEFQTAEYLSKLIAENEREISSMGNSMGTEENRDGESISRTIKKEFAVLPSQILGLNNHEYYFKQPSQNWTHVQTDFIPAIDLLENKCEPFIICPQLIGFDNDKSKVVKVKTEEKEAEKISTEEAFDRKIFG